MDPKLRALKDVEEAQGRLERAEAEIQNLREARRESFKRARGAGLTLAEIGKAAGLHRSRVDQILRRK